MQKGDRNPSNIGKAIIIPALFTGSKRYMTQYFKDSLEICRTLGHPSLFRTMTTNTKWPEIQCMLKHMPGVDVADAPDVVARVFKMKVDQLIDMIKKKNCFGRYIGVMHVIEFQKRGLPHAHILIWLHPDDRPKTTEQIDKMISAEIPDPTIDPVGYNAVNIYMIHGPCGSEYTKSPCMVKGNYIKHFPKRYNSHTFFDEYGFPIYKRRRTGITINKKGVNLDNRFVVPFNHGLLGHDMATMCLRKTRTGTSATIPKKAPKDPNDEVGRVFFIYGSGGYGKTFLWQTLCCRLRSEGKIVLPVASCGIAAVLFPGGRTAHSRFHIPLKLDQDSTTGIRHGTNIAELIQQTDSIIWDEAPIQHRHAFESVDRSLRDIMSVSDKRRAKKPFGGITVVFGGDYRQILPVISKASRA
ncbi:uncharacterized protein LOC141694456 [Apium graveolens]|uniref:uncharacterized protein LOC141694456 n=1 Tax=Apium graveolens TaxID=4045 RepID=UPI003D7B7610